MLFSNNVHSQGTVIQIESGETVTMTASLATSGSITNPVYKWYNAPIGGTLLGSSPTFTTATAITTDTAFYVSVEGDNYCVGSRLSVYVMVERTNVVTACIGEKATITASLTTSGLITNPVYKWYDAPTGGTLLGSSPTFTTATAITADTAFYVSVEGDDYCEGARLKVNVIAEICAGDIVICSGEKVTIAASLEVPGSITNPVFKWYNAPTGGTLLRTGSTFTSATALTSDTAFYVSVEGDDYCAGLRRKINVIVLNCADLAKKDATLLDPLFPHNGSYANPVSVLYGERIKYEITATNIDSDASVVTITDTLPAYINYIESTIDNGGVASTTTGLTPNRGVIRWSISVPGGVSQTVSFEATPESGASASQPLFINRAWVGSIGLPKDIPTNSTYHQGAGISIMTFSAGFGGSIYNAGEQALDYMTTPSSGIIIAPDEGYTFAGWSHDGYTSLRGAAIEAQEGIMHYDTLIIYGNVELHANFVPVELSLDSKEEVELHVAEAEDKLWAAEDELFIRTAKPGSIVRIYSLDGVLREQHTIVSPGTTSRKLPRGIYICTINNNLGNKVRIE